MGFLKDIKKLKWKDLDPNNKDGALAGNLRDLDKQILQHIEQATLQASLISIIPVAGPYIATYIAALFAQDRPHQALPLWLKLACKELNLYDQIDLTKVSFQENVKGVDGGITLGYNIFFSYDLHLDRPNVDRDHLRHTLHELQHVVQYERGGGIGPVVGKITLQYALDSLEQLGKLFDGASIKNIHDDAPLEQEADRVRDDNIERVWEIMDDIKEIHDAPRRFTPSGGTSSMRVGGGPGRRPSMIERPQELR
jgi:hypothetical protein